MGKEYIYKMDKRLLHNDGFTLIEVIFCVFIISSLSLLAVPMIRFDPQLKKENIITEVHYYQIQSMIQKQTFPLVIDKQETMFTYNSHGNINHGGRLTIDKIECIFQLGVGRVRFE